MKCLQYLHESAFFPPHSRRPPIFIFQHILKYLNLMYALYFIHSAQNRAYCEHSNYLYTRVISEVRSPSFLEIEKNIYFQ